MSHLPLNNGKDPAPLSLRDGLSVIILNWNGLELLRRFLPSVVEFTRGEGIEIVVADNGSTDSSAEWVATTYPQIRLLRFSENLGFAAGYNRALREVGTEYTILLNSDVEVRQGWWQPLLRFMREHPDCGACQPKIRSWREPAKFEYAGAAGGLIDALGFPYCRGRLFDKVETDRGQYDEAPAEVAWASGACMMVRTSAYFAVGGLDERFFAHMEEIDLCCRLAGAGWRVWAVPDSAVWHVGGASLEQGNPKKTYLNFRNNLLLLRKNLPRRRGWWMLIVRRLVDTLAWFMFIAKLDFANSKALLRAHRDYRRMKGFYTDFPVSDYMKRLPGANRLILLHFLDKHPVE